MSPLPSSQAARDLNSISTSFVKIRVLHYVSETPTTAAAIAKLIGRSGPGHCGQLLGSLVRCGLVRAKVNPGKTTKHYSLTPEGRRLLAIAKRHLREISTE